MLRKILFAVFTFLLISGCSSISVNSDYDIYADFSKYKTFYVYNGVIKDSRLESVPLAKKRVYDAIETEMQKKGFTNEDSTKAELIIYAQATTAEKLNVNSYGYSYGYGWGPYPYGRNIDVSYFTQGSLIIDFVDNENDQLVWRGIGTAVIQDKGTPEERKQFINEAVTKILDQFPPSN